MKIIKSVTKRKTTYTVIFADNSKWILFNPPDLHLYLIQDYLRNSKAELIDTDYKENWSYVNANI